MVDAGYMGAICHFPESAFPESTDPLKLNASKNDHMSTDMSTVGQSTRSSAAQEIAEHADDPGRSGNCQTVVAAKAGRRKAAADLDLPGILIALLALLLELALVAASNRYQLALHWILALHLLVVLALALWVAWRAHRRCELSGSFLLMLGTLAVGPLGAIGALAAMISAGRGRLDQHLLEVWYERISQSSRMDPVSQHCDRVAVGRTMDLGCPAPPAFSQILKDGSLAEQQGVLGLIARRFHPDYLPALQVALKSDLPVIRVQAAAVAAHVRLELRERLHDLLREAGRKKLGEDGFHPRAAFLLAARIKHCLSSGLLDEKDRLAASKASEALYDQALIILDARGSATEVLQALLQRDAAMSGTRPDDNAYANGNGAAGADPAGSVDPGGSDAADPAGGGSDAGDMDAFLEQQQATELTELYETLLLRRGRYAAFRSLRADLPAPSSGLWRVRSLAQSIRSCSKEAES